MKVYNLLLKFSMLAYASNSINNSALFNVKGDSSSVESDAECYKYLMKDEIAFCASAEINREVLEDISAVGYSNSFTLSDLSMYGNYSITNWQYKNNSNYLTLTCSQSLKNQGVIVVSDTEVVASFTSQDGEILIQPSIDENSQNNYVLLKKEYNDLEKKDIEEDTLDDEDNYFATRTIGDTNRHLAEEEIDLEYYRLNPKEVRISFFYTPESEAIIGKIESRAKLLIAVLQQTLENSKIDTLTPKMQYVGLYEHSFGPKDFNLMLNDFSKVDRRGAHVAVLVTYMHSCGYAHLECNNKPIEKVDNCPYFLLSPYCDTYSFAHEFGHLFSMRHNIEGVRGATRYQTARGYWNVSTGIRSSLSLAVTEGYTKRERYYSGPGIETPEGYILGDKKRNNRDIIYFHTGLQLLKKIEAANPYPTAQPSITPSTLEPTISPSISPSALEPTIAATISPSTLEPTIAPTISPSTLEPTVAPTISPSTLEPTISPSISPSTLEPTIAPSISPSIMPTAIPSQTPSNSDPIRFINCEEKQETLADFASRDTVLAANISNIDENCICFNIEGKSVFRHKSFMELHLYRDSQDPLTLRHVLPTRVGAFCIEFSSSTQASVTIHDKRNRLRYDETMHSTSPFIGFMDFRGDNVEYIDDVSCYTKCEDRSGIRLSAGNP